MQLKKPGLLAVATSRAGYGLVGVKPASRLPLRAARGPDEDPAPSLNANIVRLAVPSLFALALDPVLNVVDTAFVGLSSSGGAAPLAAVSAATSFFGFVFACTNCFASAGTPLVAAESRKSEVDALNLGASIVAAAALVGVLLLAASEAAAPRAMGLFAAADSGPAVSFARWRALSAPAVVLAAALNGALRGVGDARSALDAASLAAAVNVSLDVVLVLYLGFNPDGAAAATAAAEYAACGLLLCRFSGRRRAAGAGGGSLGVGLGAFANAAAATLLRTVALQGLFAATTAYIASEAAEPETALAAHLVLKQFYLVLSFATDALAVAAQQLVAAAPDARTARATADRLLLWGAGVGALFAVALRYAPPEALTSDAAVVAAAKGELVRLVAPLQLLSSLVFVGDGILQGSRDFAFEAAGVVAAAAGAAAVLYACPLDGDALSNAWDAIAVLNALRLLAFAFRYTVRGPLLPRPGET